MANPLRSLRRGLSAVTQRLGNAARTFAGCAALALFMSLHSMAAHAAFSMTPTSSPLFYTDTSVLPNLVCNYQSFDVTSTTAVTDAWVSIGSFTGPLALGGGDDGKYHLGAFTAGQTKAAFFYVCSSFTGSTSSGGYSVAIFDRDPALAGPVTLGGPTGFSVSIDNSVIQANTNVVNVIFSGPNPGTLGGIITMTVSGDTGNLGNAPGPNGPLAFTPAAYANWRADAYELIGSNITLSGGNSGSFDNTLFLPTLSSGSTTAYTVTYYFRAISTTSTTTSLSPVGYIASGAQIKHTSTTSGAYGNLLAIEPASNTLLMSKLVSAATLPAQGGRVTYTLRVTNSGAVAIALDSFVDTLPVGASYVNGSSSFGGSAIADPFVNAGTRVWSGTFTVPAGSTRDLIFQADLPATPGTYVNSATGRVGTTIIDATLSTTDNVPATATTVVLQAPVVAKSFTPSALVVNGVSVLTLTLSNPNAAQTLNGVAISDTFPSGLVTAATPNAATTCSGGTLASASGSIAISGVTLAAGASCTVTINVTSAAQGAYANTTGTVSSSNGGTGNTAGATVTLTTLPTISKSFSAATIPVNGTATLSVTLTNNGISALSTVAFTDTYPAGLVNAATPNLSNPTCGGTATAAAGGGSLSLSGGAIAVGASCTITVSVTSAVAGVYNNATSGVASNLATGPVSNTATLTVLSPPQVAKAFNPATIGKGQSSLLTITLSNASTVAISGVAFTDTYSTNMVNAASPGAGTTCGGTVSATGGGGSVALSGGTIPASGSCTVTVTVTSNVVNTTPGYVNSIPIGGVTSANAGSNTVAGAATLIVNATPTIAKAFTVDTTTGITTMTLTLTNNHTAGISGLSFSDTFPAGMLVDTTPSLTNTCGGTVTGATSGTTTLALSGGAIAGASPASCVISVRVAINAGGVYNNQTTGVSLTGPFTGTGSLSNVATLIAPIVTKTFTPNTVGPNDISRMEIKITNPSGTVALSSLAIADSYPAGVTNTGTFMVNAPTPNLTNACGGTATATAGASSLTLTGGALGAGLSCIIAVDARANPASPDTYYNKTGTVRSAQGIGGTAADALYIVNKPTITKSFLTTPVTLSGGTATSVMRIRVESNATVTLNGISFTDTFPTSPSQMRYVNTVSNGCGGTLTDQAGAALVANTSTGIRLSGVTMIAGAVCVLDVTVSVPAAGAYNNQTTGATSTTSGFISPGPVSNVATLVANLATPTAVKSFSAAQFPQNGVVTLTITLTNSNTAAVTGVTFSDTYPGTMVNAATPALTNTCGGSATAAAGAATLSLAAGTIPASGSCTLTVAVTATAAGALVNSTGAITTGNAGTVAAVSANVTVIGLPALTFTKSVVTLCDPFNFNTNPKAIPGAYMRYEIIIANGGGAAGSATLSTLGDMLDLNLNFDADLRTGSASACAASSPENALLKGFRLVCSGTTRTSCASPVYYTSAADTDAMGITGSSITLTFGDGPTGTKALPTETGYTPGELKPGESVTIRFNTIVK